MQALPAFVPTHAGDSSQVVFELVEIQTPTPIYWTTCNIPLYALSQMWTPRPLKISGLDTSQGEVENVALEVGDADGFLALQDLGGAGLVGTSVIIRQIWLDASAPMTVLGTIVRYDGQIEKPSYTEALATFKLRGPILLSGRQFPSIKCAPTCPYVFGGPVCGYNLYLGATSCGRSYTDCVAKGGTQAIRFGGMRSIPAPGTKITWGAGGFRLG
jgi:phage-related protein